MAEPEAVKPTADRRAMHAHVVRPFHLHAQFVQRQVAPLGQPPADPALQIPKLAGAAQISLTLRRKAARVPAQLDHVVHKFRRNTKMTRRRTVRMTIIDKRDNTFPHLYRMWLTHG